MFDTHKRSTGLSRTASKRMNRHTTDSGDKVLHSCDDVRTHEIRIIGFMTKAASDIARM